MHKEKKVRGKTFEQIVKDRENLLNRFFGLAPDKDNRLGKKNSFIEKVEKKKEL